MALNYTQARSEPITNALSESEVFFSHAGLVMSYLIKLMYESSVYVL